jgi:peptidoglycan/xylan/chitin deacetylase (PgdA/CDA1 family)
MRVRPDPRAVVAAALATVLGPALAGCGSAGPSRAPAASVRGRAGAASVPGIHQPAGPASAAGQAAEDAAVRRVLGYTSYVAAGSRRRRDVALTFDDGPSPFTVKVLAILERERAAATFFDIGRAAQMFPALVARERRDGFAIGDHTQAHPAMAALSPGAQAEQIDLGAAHIRAAGGPVPRLFRPPYGSFDAATQRALRARGMLMVLWTVDTSDFSRPGTARIVYAALSGARSGAIVLMHDGGGPREQTVAALPRIIRKLRRRGFRLVTVPQMLREDPPPRARPGTAAPAVGRRLRSRAARAGGGRCLTRQRRGARPVRPRPRCGGSGRSAGCRPRGTRRRRCPS